MDKIEPKYLQAVELIKKAILQSQYNAIRLANQEQLQLYFAIGRYISENSRTGYWGTGALAIISGQLKEDLLQFANRNWRILRGSRWKSSWPSRSRTISGFWRG
ncbi:MAG: hypothetical protein IJ603_01010 [Bacteroidales bacterium]|nr:hypothetical protein [Bacteroidales bacterium]